jgi:hypothetical protein
MWETQRITLRFASYLLFIVLILACRDSSVDVSSKKMTTTYDTLLLTENGDLLSCCNIDVSIIVVGFPDTPKILHSFSTGNGANLFKQYEIGDKVDIKIEYISHPTYDADMLYNPLYCYTSKDDCSASPIVDEGTVKTSKIHCIDSTLMCMGFGKFDGKGYMFVKVEDNRPIQNKEKEAFASNFLSNITKKDTVFHFDSTLKGQLDTNHFDQCIGKAVGQVTVEDKADKGELFIAVEKDWYDKCIELHSLADCVIDNYFLGKGFKLITLVSPIIEKDNFERLATFIVRENTAVKPKDEREIILNFVDCIWLNEAFAQKLYSAEDCERYHSFKSN